MSLTNLKSGLAELARRYQEVKEKGLNERMTENEFVYPFLTRCLGYDDPDTLKSQYAVDAKDIVDYAVLDALKNPIIFIENKKLSEPLSQHYPQLRRYFNIIPSVKFGILSNGYDYHFYTDLDKDNVLDPKPFLSFNLEDYTNRLHAIVEFSGKKLDLSRLRNLAREYYCLSKTLVYLEREVANRDSDLVKFITKNVFDSPPTKADQALIQKVFPSACKEWLNLQVSKKDSPQSEKGVNLLDIKDFTNHRFEYFEYEKERVDDQTFIDMYRHVVKSLFERDRERLLKLIGNELSLGLVQEVPMAKNDYYEPFRDGYHMRSHASAKVIGDRLKELLRDFGLSDSLYLFGFSRYSKGD